MLEPLKKTRLTCTVGGIEIALETGRFANQADGSIWIQCGGTVILVTAVTQPLEVDKGFFPLVCHYQEMSYAAGRIPGGYFRREIGRPSDRETLVSRLIDRPIRPLFPKGFKDEVQVIATVLSADRDVNPDVLALTGASAALTISKIPFSGPVAGTRVGYLDGEFVLFPTYKHIAENSALNLVLAGTRDAVVMVEGAAEFLHEDTVAKAIAWGHDQLKPLFDLQEEMREAVGRPKMVVVPPAHDADLEAAVREMAQADLAEAVTVKEKFARKDARKAVKKGVLETLVERDPERAAEFAKAVPHILEDMEKEIVREMIATKGVRMDGRGLTDVRGISIDAGLLPQTHGSSLFRRGETSALCIATLGSSRDEQRIETLIGEKTKSFMLHYNFPPYSVGEVKMLRGPSRREIGHGNLAERAIKPVLPKDDSFPFTIRLVSEIMDSNGSSSMATVCGGSLALMDAGVPMKDAVAGIAMGLAKVGDDYFVLTDILGDEDALGDMDFKVAGTREGITAIQMDIKISGIPQNVLERALKQARDGRLHILDCMAEALPASRSSVSALAPQHKEIWINPDKIRDVIGPGGKNIKAITAATETTIDIEDSGRVQVFAPNVEAMEKAAAMIGYYDQTPEVGKNYVGPVKKLTDFGAFIEVLPGVEGLLHVSQIDVERVENAADVLQLGQEVTVKVIEVEPSGKFRLSRKAWLMEQAGQEIDLADFGRPPRREGDRGGDRRGGDRGGDRGGRSGDRRGGGDRGGRR